MEYRFVINGLYYKNRTLPGLNDYLHECGINPKAGGRMKKDYQFIIRNAIRLQLKKVKIEKPLMIHYKFYEVDRQRDKSNIFSVAAKFIEDALQECKVIKNDGWSEIVNFTHDFYIDQKNPRIEVVLEEVGDND